MCVLLFVAKLLFVWHFAPFVALRFLLACVFGELDSHPIIMMCYKSQLISASLHDQ